MLEYVGFIAAIVLLMLYWRNQASSRKCGRTIPGLAPRDKIQGNLPDLHAAGSLHELLTSLHGTYGPIASFWWGPTLTVSIASHALFKQHSKSFDRPPALYGLFEPLWGPQSMCYANGEDGRRRHVTYARCFSPDVIDQYYGTFHKVTMEQIIKWRSIPRGEHIALHQSMMAFAVKTALIGCFGAYFDDDIAVGRIREAYNYTWSEMENRLRHGIPAQSSDRQEQFEKHKWVIRDMISTCINERIHNVPAAGEYLVLDAMMSLHDDKETIISDAVTTMVAGLHTSGLLLTWSLYYLASEPDMQQKLYTEFQTVLGGDKVSPDNIKCLTYLQQVIDETLRRSVLAPYAARVDATDIMLGGHVIPAGTPVIQALGVTLHDPDLYPDPLRFDPDRFTDKAKKSRPGYSFGPFGFAGKRKCMAYRFGELEASVALAEIIGTFQVELVSGQDVVMEHGLVTAPKEEIWITLKERK